jgi:hypothetical protein
MKASGQAALQEALETEAKVIREASAEGEFDGSNLDEWSDSLFEVLTDSPGVMMALVHELFELVTGQEVED